MSTAAPTDVRARTWLIGISTDECADLPSASGLGRLAMIVNGRPQILPVNHVYDRPSGCVVFPTRVGTKLHGGAGLAVVAFEVDGSIGMVAAAGACSSPARPRTSPTPS